MEYFSSRRLNTIKITPLIIEDSGSSSLKYINIFSEIYEYMGEKISLGGDKKWRLNKRTGKYNAILDANRGKELIKHFDVIFFCDIFIIGFVYMSEKWMHKWSHIIAAVW